MKNNLVCLFDHPSMVFSDDEVQVFYNEGWYIMDANGDFQLQRLDEEAKLADDASAWKLVWDRATDGSAPHMKALAFLYQFATAEYNLILAAVRTH